MDATTDIIYVGNPFHADNRTSSHHIARQLAGDYRVFYIEAGGLRAPRANFSDLKRILQRLAILFKPVKEVESNIFVKSIFSIPFGRVSLIARINSWIQRLTLARLFNKYGIERPIVWCVSPALVDTLEALPRSLLVYYCVDDFCSFPDVDVLFIQAMDQKLTQQADIVFTPSAPLYEKKLKLNVHSFLAPHGVDVDHFGLAQQELEPPELIKPLLALKKPIIGFWGLIEAWIDLELVCFIANARPQWQIFMIGRVAVEIDTSMIPENLHFVGQVPYEDLPVYARFFDVAIIPYKLNEQVHNANPLKLREYLATGKPLVSVRSPEIEKYQHVVPIADSYKAFLENIDAELRGESYSSVDHRIAAISDESWRARYCAVIDHVEARIAEVIQP